MRWIATKRNHVDWVLLAAVTFLLAVGTIVLFAIEEAAVNQVNFSPYKHLLHVVVGVILAFVVYRSNYAIWYRLGTWLYWISIVLLVVVLFANPTAGSSRWIELGFIQFQPSELAKFSLVILLARLFAHRSGQMSKIPNLLLSILYMAIPVVLTLLQPDLGTAVVFIVIWLSMIAVSDVRPLYLAVGGIVVAAAVTFAIPNLADYQQQRITTFLDPAADPRGAGYNVRQATIAIGSGGLIGQGLDSGSQSQLNFLPAQHTDFIFAVISEKLGFIGAAAIVFAFAVIVVQALRKALRLKSGFATHLALGFGVLLAFHAIINIGMNLGLVPVTGLPLPFLSYGGTHLIMIMAIVGILLSIERTNELSYSD